MPQTPKCQGADWLFGPGWVAAGWVRCGEPATVCGWSVSVDDEGNDVGEDHVHVCGDHAHLLDELCVKVGAV